VVVDITNPVNTETWDGLATAPGSSSPEEIRRLLPEGAAVVKAFNTTFAGPLVAGEVGGQRLDVLIAGDDDNAERKVSRLVSDGGLRPLDVGPLRRAQQLEQLGFLSYFAPAAARSELRQRGQAGPVSGLCCRPRGLLNHRAGEDGPRRRPSAGRLEAIVREVLTGRPR
jgi:predicted dinucleotide-binding enzyme